MRCVLIVTAAACSPDLPPDWAGATPVDGLEQRACDGSPLTTDVTPRIQSDLGGDPLEVAVFDAHFRCAQDVEAFWMRDGDEMELLIQPVDMNPTVVASCDCLYDLVIDVTTTAEPPTSLTVFRRWDHLNDPNPLVELGQVVLGPKGVVTR